VIKIRLLPEQKREMKRTRLTMGLIGGDDVGPPLCPTAGQRSPNEHLHWRFDEPDDAGGKNRQLNLLSVGSDVTGPQVSRDAETKIRQGRVGGILNTDTPEAVRKLQSLAVKESRWASRCCLGPMSFTATRRFSQSRLALLHLEPGFD